MINDYSLCTYITFAVSNHFRRCRRRPRRGRPLTRCQTIIIPVHTSAVLYNNILIFLTFFRYILRTSFSTVSFCSSNLLCYVINTTLYTVMYKRTMYINVHCEYIILVHCYDIIIINYLQMMMTSFNIDFHFYRPVANLALFIFRGADDSIIKRNNLNRLYL